MKTPSHPVIGRCRRLRARLPLATIASLVIASSASSALAGTITLRPDYLGATPEVVGSNFGHYAAGTNAGDWWDYFGVKTARVFVSPSTVEYSDDIAARGDGVITRDDFFARRTAMDANALNTAYINWPYLENRYANATFTGNVFKLDHAFGSLRDQGIDILVNITAGLNDFTISSSSDWAGKWELWQHYYAQAFYLAREFDIRRYSMFNEPNHEAAAGITPAQWQERLELASDAIQRAIDEVNSRYSKSLVARVYAPTTSGANLDVWNEWGLPAMTYRHRKANGYSYADWLNFQVYAFQNYGATGHTDGTAFSTRLQETRDRIAAVQTPAGETPLGVAVTEFNSLPNYLFQETTHTMDTPQRYAQLGSIAARLVTGFVREMFVFKFAQTTNSGSGYEMTKNGLHYVDNDSASPSAYRYGGITKAGEVYRLFVRAAAPGRDRLAFTRGTGLDALDILHVQDDATGFHHVFLANTGTSSVSVDFNTAQLGSLQDHRVVLREVSETSNGGVKAYTRVNGDAIAAQTMPAQSVWLLSIPTRPQTITANGTPSLAVDVSQDAMVKDGANKFANYGSSTSVVVKNDASSANGRNAGLLKFDISPGVDMSKIELAVLTVNAKTFSGTSGPAQASLYGLTSDSWAEGAINWSTAAGLKQDQPVGNRIRNAVINGQGSTTRLAGQLLVTSATNAEYQIDVTEFVKTQTDRVVSFILVQDPRRDQTIKPAGPLPAAYTGDTLDSGAAPDGISIVSKEGAAAAGVSGPRLLIVRRQ